VVGFDTREPGEMVKDRACLVLEVENVDIETWRLRALGAMFKPSRLPERW
jgi:hypothetical protein